MKPALYLLAILAICFSSPELGWCQIVRGRSAPEQALLRKLTGDCYLSQGKISRSIEEYKKALLLNSHSTATYFNLAIAYYAQRNLEGATSALEELLKINEQDVEAWYNLACLNLYQQDTEKAKLHFEKAKLCCDCNSKFVPLIMQGLEFLNELKNSGHQDLILLLLQKGLPPLASS